MLTKTKDLNRTTTTVTLSLASVLLSAVSYFWYIHLSDDIERDTPENTKRKANLHTGPGKQQFLVGLCVEPAYIHQHWFLVWPLGDTLRCENTHQLKVLYMLWGPELYVKH